MKKNIRAILLFAFISMPLLVFPINGNSKEKINPVSEAKMDQWLANSGGLRFLENKGQLLDMQGKATPNLLFKANLSGVDMYISTNGISYVFNRIEEEEENANAYRQEKQSSMPEMEKEKIAGEYCRADMELVGAAIRKENIIKEGENEEFSNYYYGGICPDGILNVHTYQRITIKNIYPGIDWVLFTADASASTPAGKNGIGGLKYNFIVHPGANPSVIKLRYKWTDKPVLQRDGSLKITTPMGSITEGSPISYSATQRNGIETSYVLQGHDVSFKLGKYNNSETLLIDPTLVWGTYFMADPANEPTCMHADGTNVWITGSTISTVMPTVNPGSGAYFQGTIAGFQNIFILKFNNAGVLKWATYYGGSLSSDIGYDTNDLAYSINSDGANVWVTGITESIDFPLLNPLGGAYFQSSLQPASGGNRDAFILQFNTSGKRIWATYYGGGLWDVGNSISSDGTNVWVTGFTMSTDLPVVNPANGAYFQGAVAGNGDAFILQFSSTGTLKWATYCGGNADDLGTSIDSDGNNVWVSGFTWSSNLPTLNPLNGAYFQGALGGIRDAFILQFNTSGVRQWATYFGGSGNEPGWTMGSSTTSHISSDGTNVWMVGSTSSTDLPLANPLGGAYFQGSLSGADDAFIAQFNTQGVLKWSTYYGGSVNDNVYDVQSDGSNVWICGGTTSADLPVQPANSCSSFYKPSLTGTTFGSMTTVENAYILQFDLQGVRKWATYYGHDVENDGSFIASDGTNLFVSGDAYAPTAKYPLLDPGGGAYYQNQTTMNTGVAEGLFIGKFCIACGGGLTETAIQTKGACASQPSGIATASTTGGTAPLTYQWSGTGGQTGAVASGLAAGTYTVTVTDASGVCTTSTTVTIAPSAAMLVNATSTPTGCNSKFDGTATATPSGGMSGYTFSWLPSGQTAQTAVGLGSGTYTVTVEDFNGCTETQTASVGSANPPTATIATQTNVVCYGNATGSATLNVNGGTTPYTYNWLPSGGTTATESGLAAGSYTCNITGNDGCSATQVVMINQPSAIAIAVSSTQALCSVSNGTATAMATNGYPPYTYSWSDGQVAQTATSLTAGTYTVIVKDVNTCSQSQTITITQATGPATGVSASATIISNGGNSQLNATGGGAYVWSPVMGLSCSACNNPIATPLQTTAYCVTVTDANTCTSSACITISVETPCGDVFVPNVFSPNADGTNDIECVMGNCVQNILFVIYDRWGEVVFTSNNSKACWDGTYKGQLMNSAVFVYSLEATLLSGQKIEKKGNITLLR